MPLGLAEDGLGRKLADREGARFQDAGRPLSEVRDAGVLVETLERLVERSGDLGRPESTGPACEALLRHKRDVCRRVLDEGDALANVAKTIEEARRDVKRWEVRGAGWHALEGGLRRIYERAYRAFHEAAKTPTA